MKHDIITGFACTLPLPPHENVSSPSSLNYLRNRSQLDDARHTQQEQFYRMIHHKRGNPLGIETPLGHTYTLFMEAAEEQRVQSKKRRITPNPGAFIEAIREGLKSSGHGLGLKLSMQTPTFYPYHARAAIKYMHAQGLSLGRCAQVMQAVYGPDMPEELSARNLRRFR